MSQRPDGTSERGRSPTASHVKPTGPVPIAPRGDAGVVAELLHEAVRDYVEHVSWRCGHPDRWPHDPDCHCGLVGFLRRVEQAGIPVQTPSKPAG